MMIVAARETKALPRHVSSRRFLRAQTRNWPLWPKPFSKLHVWIRRRRRKLCHQINSLGRCLSSKFWLMCLNSKVIRDAAATLHPSGMLGLSHHKNRRKAEGPFSGTIAATYKRRELAEAILEPSKSIAQGFATNVFTMKDGSVQAAVVREASDAVTIRNATAREFVLQKSEITETRGFGGGLSDATWARGKFEHGGFRVAIKIPRRIERKIYPLTPD